MATIRMANGDTIEVEEEAGPVANSVRMAEKATRSLIALHTKEGKLIVLSHGQISSIE